jgi:hypothetical protein
VQVSDFVLPTYFATFLTAGPFDFGKHLSKVLPAMTPGGYLSYFDASDGQWHQITARRPTSSSPGREWARAAAVAG